MSGKEIINKPIMKKRSFLSKFLTYFPASQNAVWQFFFQLKLCSHFENELMNNFHRIRFAIILLCNWIHIFKLLYDWSTQIYTSELVQLTFNIPSLFEFTLVCFCSISYSLLSDLRNSAMRQLVSREGAGA